MADAKISQLPDAAALTGSELVPLTQGGVTRKATVALVAAINGGEASPRSATFTLSASEHHGRTVTCTATLTVTIPSAATLGAGFRCDVYASAGTTTLNGPGATNVTLAAGEVATVFTANGSVVAAKGLGVVI